MRRWSQPVRNGAGRAGETQARHQLLRQAQLVVVVGAEVLVAQHLDGREAQRQRRVVVGLAGVVARRPRRCRRSVPA